MMESNTKLITQFTDTYQGMIAFPFKTWNKVMHREKNRERKKAAAAEELSFMAHCI